MLLLLFMLSADQGHESSSYWAKGRNTSWKGCQVITRHTDMHYSLTHAIILLNQWEGKFETLPLHLFLFSTVLDFYKLKNFIYLQNSGHVTVFVPHWFRNNDGTFWKPAKLQLTHKLFSPLSSCVLMQNQSASQNLISQKMGWYCSTISVAKVCHGPRLINVHLGIFNLGCLVWGKIKIAPSRRVTPRYSCNQSD